MPLALAQQLGVGYAAPGSWPHAARDWRNGRVVFPHTMPEGRLVNLYGRAVGTAEQVPKAKRHDHLPGGKGHIPSDLVVNQWVRDVVSSSPRDFLSLHNLWTTFGRLIRSHITSKIST